MSGAQQQSRSVASQSPYAQLFRIPGAKAFCISGAVARLPISMMSLGIVMDERIATCYEYASFYNDFRNHIRRPELLETPFDGSAAPEAAKADTEEPAAV